MFSRFLLNPSKLSLSIGYQVVWFLCIGLAARGYPVYAAFVTILYGLWSLVGSRHVHTQLIWFSMSGALLGYIVDSALVLYGVISFPESAQLGGPSPMWMVSLWFAFASFLGGPLLWLLKRPLFVVALGGIGGPLSYIGGSKSGAMHLMDSTLQAGLIIGLAWATVMTFASLWARGQSLPVS